MRHQVIAHKALSFLCFGGNGVETKPTRQYHSDNRRWGFSFFDKMERQIKTVRQEKEGKEGKETTG